MSVRHLNRKRKSLLKNPMKPVKRPKMQPDIDSVGKDLTFRPVGGYNPAGNRSDTSSGSSGDDNDFDTTEKFVNRSNGNLK